MIFQVPKTTHGDSASVSDLTDSICRDRMIAKALILKEMQVLQVNEQLTRMRDRLEKIEQYSQKKKKKHRKKYKSRKRKKSGFVTGIYYFSTNFGSSIIFYIVDFSLL